MVRFQTACWWQTRTKSAAQVLEKECNAVVRQGEGRVAEVSFSTTRGSAWVRGSLDYNVNALHEATGREQAV